MLTNGSQRCSELWQFSAVQSLLPLPLSLSLSFSLLLSLPLSLAMDEPTGVFAQNSPHPERGHGLNNSGTETK